ncbi:MAG: SDR family NAD(P)-dependent oxidoreductase [Planctomycetes bacterium]|nr:SDR family NAD(P)-dependent oxidoreductase [Planctomycetota bacterium]
MIFACRLIIFDGKGYNFLLGTIEEQPPRGDGAPMPHPFHNHVALVTGASSGIGHSLAMQLAKHGAKVGVIARRRELLEELVNSIRSAGGVAAFATADVGRRDETQAAVAEIRRQLGPIDLLIANAGVGTPTLLEPLNIRDVEKMFQVNVLGTIYAIEAVLPEMVSRKTGRIAAVSSLAAFKGLPGESGYCASKAAVNAYLEGLRIQLHGRGISVTLACPGFVKTPMTEINDFSMPFLLSADQAADHVLWAIRRRKKMHRFPRRMSWIVRLTGLLPDWMIARGMKSYGEKPPMNDLG